MKKLFAAGAVLAWVAVIAVAIGVLIDTVIVRTLVVPAVTHVLGGFVWWPSKLAADRSREALEDANTVMEVTA